MAFWVVVATVVVSLALFGLEFMVGLVGTAFLAAVLLILVYGSYRRSGLMWTVSGLLFIALVLFTSAWVSERLGPFAAWIVVVVGIVYWLDLSSRHGAVGSDADSVVGAGGIDADGGDGDGC